MAAREGHADRLLGQRRRAVAGRPPEQDVGDVEVALAAHADGVEHAVHELAAHAHERLAQPVLVGARRLAHDHDRRAGHAVGEHGVLGGALERAALEGAHGRLELGDGRRSAAPARAHPRRAAAIRAAPGARAEQRRRRARGSASARPALRGRRAGGSVQPAVAGARSGRSPPRRWSRRSRGRRTISAAMRGPRGRSRLGHGRRFRKAPRIGAHRAASAWLAMWPLLVGSST